MSIGGGSLLPNMQQLQSPAALNKTATADPVFDQTVSQALNAAFGADPTTGQVMAGPISHLMDRMQGDMNRAGLNGLGGLFPDPAGGATAGGFQSPMPPLLTGGMGGMFPGGGALVNAQTSQGYQNGSGVGALGQTGVNAQSTSPFGNVNMTMGGNAMPAATANRQGNNPHQFAPMMENNAVGMVFQLASIMMLMMQGMLGAMGSGASNGGTARGQA